MKKLILAFAVLALSSCVAYNQENINLNLATAPRFTDADKSKTINLSVVDSRLNPNLVGQKRLGETVISIKPTEDLVKVIQNKLTRDLDENGFTVMDSADKFLEIKILTLNYSAYREFFTGTSKIEISLKITAKNKNNKTIYSNTQNLILSNEHFIMPLISTDEKIINSALQESLNDLFTNQKLLEFLNN